MVEFMKKNYKLYMNEVTQTQKNILDEYRLTEEFKNKYGNYIIDNPKEGKAVKWAIEKIKMYKHTDNVTIKKYRKTIIDLLYARRILGFLSWEYFAYNLEGKKIKDWVKFIPQKQVIEVYSYININKNQNNILNEKNKAYDLFKDFFKRDIITISSKNDFNTFKNFCKKNNEFIVKPYDQACGRGIYIVKIDKKDKLNKIFDDILNNGICVCEELIVNHPEIKKFHPNSVNSCRVITYNDGKKAKIVCAWFKCGIGNGNIDNGSAGGIASAIDINTGKLTTNAASENNQNYKVHPDTNIKFKGFQIPDWQECINMAKEASERLPDVPLVGWDFALSENKGWQMIEGNVRSQTNIIQMATKQGIKSYLLKEIEYKKHLKNNKNLNNKIDNIEK